MSASRFCHIAKTGRLVPAATPAAALAAAAREGFAWLDFVRPSKAELLPLVDSLGLHPLAIEDCTDERSQVPKIDDFPGNTFILFNDFRHAAGKFSLAEVDVFIGSNFLVTVQGCEPEAPVSLNDFGKVVEREIDNIRQGPAFLLHVILDHVVDQKFLAIEALEEELNQAEDRLVSDLPAFKPAVLLHLRRDLLALRKSLFHEREILVKICRKDCPFIPEKAIFYYRDIYDHLTKFFELTESCREVVTSLMEMYLSMLNNRMAMAANDTNQTVRRLTLITTIFMPLTLLAGIGGMSEWSMMTGPANWKTSYPAFLAAMAAIGWANYVLLKWLEKKKRDRP